MKVKKITCIAIILMFACGMHAQNDDWYYTEGGFKPEIRLVFKIKNTLKVKRENYPVVIKRKDFPYPDEHPLRMTVVDPSLPPYEGPSELVLAQYGGHQLRAETNGHALFRQFDDLDKDGIWDELFFQVDLEPDEEKLIYVYMGENGQGWNKHFTHTNIGNYCRHEVPFWESEHVGWKHWFSGSADVFAKRKPVLMAHRLYMENYDGYEVQMFNSDWGTDIQQVAETMGGGAVCLYEHAEYPDSASLPRFTAIQDDRYPKSMFNAGPISDTRYANEVISNGPVRSIIRIKTMNWNTEAGSYSIEQYYTVYAHHNYSTCEVKFKQFDTKKPGVKMACGIRKKPKYAEELYQQDGIIISSGPEVIKDPEDIDNREEVQIPFVGKALVVKDIYKPEYQFAKNLGENHTFKVEPDSKNRYEYILFAAWSEGAVLNTKEDFEEYVKQTSLEFNNPATISFIRKEEK